MTAALRPSDEGDRNEPGWVCRFVASCGAGDAIRPPVDASQEPSLRAEVARTAAGAETVAQARDHDAPPPASAEGLLELIQLRDLAVTDERRKLWNRDFVRHVEWCECYVADVVAERPDFGSHPRWDFEVVRTMNGRSPQRVGAKFPGSVPDAAAIAVGERWVLQGVWHKTGFSVVAAWKHSDAVVEGLERLLGTLDTLRVSARPRIRQLSKRMIARDLAECDVWLGRAVGHGGRVDERNLVSRQFQVEQVLRGRARSGTISCLLGADQSTGLELDAPVILLVASSPPDVFVQIWWPRTPEVLETIRTLVAVSDE